jgi:hypothetical protein
VKEPQEGGSQTVQDQGSMVGHVLNVAMAPCLAPSGQSLLALQGEGWRAHRATQWVLHSHGPPRIARLLVSPKGVFFPTSWSLQHRLESDWLASQLWQEEVRNYDFLCKAKGTQCMLKYASPNPSHYPWDVPCSVNLMAVFLSTTTNHSSYWKPGNVVDL